MNDQSHLDRLTNLTLPERQAEMRAGTVDLTATAHTLAERMDGSRLNAFVTPLLNQTPRTGHLSGVLLAVKDNIALEGVALTCASRILDGYESLFTATALQRLIHAGVIVVGKTNLDEFAMGSSTEFSAFGPSLNPHDVSRVPGGSSGGSAVAVAAGLATAALGSETGGSVRQPAAFCGVLGLKPTYGRVSRYGLVAFGSSLDQIGVFARKADEIARVFEVMAGLDPLDNTTSPVPVPDCSGGLGGSLEGLRVGLPKEYMGEGVQPEIEAAIRRATGALRKMGAKVEICSLPHTQYAIPVYYILAPAEASSNLARYDGVRYGKRIVTPPPAPPASEGGNESGASRGGKGSGTIGGGKETEAGGADSDDIIRLSRQAGFGPEVKRRIMMGTYVLSSGYYDAYYLKAQKVRRLIREDFVRVFHDFDLLLTPTTPTTAFKFGEKVDDPLEMYLSDVFTTPANLAGIPAISVPFGADDKGLPIGIQLMANDFREDLLLRAAAQLEEVRS